LKEKKEKKDQEKTKTRILVVDDHDIVRKGLTLLINQEPDLMVCAEAENGENIFELIENHKVDLAIIDISLNDMDGIELTQKVKSRYPHLPVLILTMHNEAIYSEKAFEAGAGGYIKKQEAAETIITAIRLMLSSRGYTSVRMAEKL